MTPPAADGDAVTAVVVAAVETVVEEGAGGRCRDCPRGSAGRPRGR